MVAKETVNHTNISNIWTKQELLFFSIAWSFCIKAHDVNIKPITLLKMCSEIIFWSEQRTEPGNPESNLISAKDSLCNLKHASLCFLTCNMAWATLGHFNPRMKC